MTDEDFTLVQCRPQSFVPLQPNAWLSLLERQRLRRAGSHLGVQVGAVGARLLCRLRAYEQAASFQVSCGFEGCDYQNALDRAAGQQHDEHQHIWARQALPSGWWQTLSPQSMDCTGGSAAAGGGTRPRRRRDANRHSDRAGGGRGRRPHPAGGPAALQRRRRTQARCPGGGDGRCEEILKTSITLVICVQSIRVGLKACHASWTHWEMPNGASKGSCVSVAAAVPA